MIVAMQDTAIKRFHASGAWNLFFVSCGVLFLDCDFDGKNSSGGMRKTSEKKTIWQSVTEQPRVSMLARICGVMLHPNNCSLAANSSRVQPRWRWNLAMYFPTTLRLCSIHERFYCALDAD
jgi:hypothetical protein